MVKNNDISSKKVAVATKWSLITEFCTKLVSPLINMILARLLAPDAFGAVASINIIIMLAEIFTDAGFQKYIIQHDFEDDKDFNNSVDVAFWSNFILSAAIVFVIFLYKKPLAELLGNVDLANGIFVSSLSIILNALSSIHLAIYRRNLEFKVLFWIRIVTAFIPLIVTIPLAFILKNYWALIWGTLAVKAAQAIIVFIKTSHHIHFFYSVTVLKKMFSYASLTLLETISIWLTSNIDIFIVGNTLNSYYLGLYKTSMSTVGSYMSIISASITSVLFSTLSRYKNDEEKYTLTYCSFQRNLAIFLIPMGQGIFVYRNLVTRILLGEEWMAASEFIGMWGLMSSFSITISYFASEVFRSKGKPLISIVHQIIHTLVLIPVVLISAKQGFETLIIARSLAVLELILSALIIVQVCFKISALKVLKNICPQILSAFVMSLFALLVKDQFNSVAWELMTIPLCVVVYFSILCLFPSMRNVIFNIKLVRKVCKKLSRRG